MTTFTFHFFIFHLSNIRLFTGTDGSTAGYSIGFQGLPLHFIEKTHGSSPTTDSFSTCIDASAIYDQIRLRGFCHGTTKLGERWATFFQPLDDISSKTTWVMGISLPKTYIILIILHIIFRKLGNCLIPFIYQTHRGPLFTAHLDQVASLKVCKSLSKNSATCQGPQAAMALP